MPAKPLSQEQLEDARRLKLAFIAWQQAQRLLGRPFSQETFATNLTFGQSALSQYLGGKIPLNADALAEIAGQLKVDPASISPSVVAGLSASAERLTGQPVVPLYAPTGSGDEPAKDAATFATRDPSFIYSGHPKFMGVAPVISIARVDDDGFFQEERFAKGAGGWVPSFGPNPTVALLVKGDGLAPAYESGQYLLIEPGAPAHSGERVLITFKDGRQAIRKLMFQRQDEISVTAVNKVLLQTLEMRDIAAIDPIFGVIEASRWMAELPSQTPDGEPEANETAVPPTHPPPAASATSPASRYVKSENMGATAKKGSASKRGAA